MLSMKMDSQLCYVFPCAIYLFAMPLSLAFYFGIKKNLLTAKSQYPNDVKTLLGKDLTNSYKTINVELMEWSLRKYNDEFPIPNDQDLKNSFEVDFNSFFNSTTKGTDPEDMNKRLNSIIHNKMMDLYKREKTNDSAKFNVFKYIDWCLDKLEERGCMSLVAAKPQKDASDREIYVQEYFSKVGHFACQQIFKKLCEKCPNEMVTKSEMKKLESISLMDFSNSAYINIDMKKWSSHDMKLKFSILIELMKNQGMLSKDMYSLLSRSFNLIEKFCHIIRH